MGNMRTKTTEVKEWKKPPRSSRICFLCNHKYASHTDRICLKIVANHPKQSCKCTGFMTEKDVENQKIFAEQKKSANLD